MTTLPGRRQRQPRAPTLGGRKLRGVREATGLSLIELASTIQLEHGASIDAGHINKIETGRIKEPHADTVSAILTGLKASYRDRRDVLEAFGYRAARSLPTDEEIEEARMLCAQELDDATCPVYLIDDGQRLLAWNRYVPRLIGMRPDDSRLTQFMGCTTIDLAFNPVYPTMFLIDNPKEYLPLMLHAIKTGLQSYQGETWYADLITHARRLPGFTVIWDALPANAVQRVASQPTFPINLDVPNIGLLQFRLTSNPFILDRRFQIIHYVPYGAVTLRQCALWAEEEGVS